jgi:hypothetical protein
VRTCQAVCVWQSTIVAVPSVGERWHPRRETRGSGGDGSAVGTVALLSLKQEPPVIRSPQGGSLSVNDVWLFR